MIHDRIGTALMLIASAWLIMLVATEPGMYAENSYRVRVGIIATIILVTTFFPRHLPLSGTVLAFVSLGLTLHISLFGLFGMDIQGAVPAVVFGLAMWLRRHRLDATDIVLITSLVACGLSVVQPNVVFFTLAVVAAVNLLMWLGNAFGTKRSQR